MDVLQPKDRAEEVAVFRSQVIGVLVCQALVRGELRAELCRLSTMSFRPPGAQRTRTFSVPTLERWFYAWRSGGLEALRPAKRSDAGHAQALTAEQRALLLDIRREYAGASAELILSTLVSDGRLDQEAVSPATVRRLFAEHDLPRITAREAARGKGHGKGKRARLRWQMAEPNMLWHGDVCHAPPLVLAGGKSRPVRVHALLDDASRYVVAIAAYHTEREVDLIDMLVPALRRHGRPDSLYLDNGSTYSGKLLATACPRLGVALLHARPYDPEARGRMERFWRTLREGALDFMGGCTSLHDINVRLWAFVDRHYHNAPHAGLMGKSPASAFAARQRADVRLTEEQLATALTMRSRRNVARDSTLSIGGQVYETDAGFLAGKTVTVARCHLGPTRAPWVEHEEKRFILRPVDAVANAHRRREPLPVVPARHVEFDPPGVMLDAAVGRKPRHGADDGGEP